MSNGGSYPSTPKAELLADGRIIKLLEAFCYIDPNGEKWTAPKGTQADGASIPRPLWPIMGSPLTGKYRDASIIHDFYCSKRNRPWARVHRTFFDAMITSGVSKAKAKLMYAGVRWGGPRWTDMDVNNANIDDDSGGPVHTFAGFPGNGGGSVRVRRTPSRPGKLKKPAAYNYELSADDIKTLKGSIAEAADIDLDAIDETVERMIVKSGKSKFA